MIISTWEVSGLLLFHVVKCTLNAESSTEVLFIPHGGLTLRDSAASAC